MTANTTPTDTGEQTHKEIWRCGSCDHEEQAPVGGLAGEHYEAQGNES